MSAAQPERDFREIYEAHKSRVYNTALSYTHSSRDSEEITQDVFVELYYSLANFRGEAALSTWIYRITVNKSLDFLRHKKRQKRFALVTGLFGNGREAVPEPADFEHPGVLLENRERSALLFKAIDRLPEQQKTAFILARIEGLSYAEVAEVLRNSVPAVESLLSRAKENLRKILVKNKSGF